MDVKLLTTCVCLLAASCLFAQDSSTVRKSMYPEPAITIKGEEFSKFPSMRFLDAMKGLFPFQFEQDAYFDKYLYVVNGNVMADINGISLYDIEEVSFVRNRKDVQLYPFSRAGTFYIKTKVPVTAKAVFSFNSQYNVSWNNTVRSIQELPPNVVSPPYVDTLDKKPGYLHSTQISVAAAINKLTIYASVQYDQFKMPSVIQRRHSVPPYTPSYADVKNGNRPSALKTFVTLNYNIARWINAGININYVHSITKTDTGFARYERGAFQAFSTDKGKAIYPYFHTSIYVDMMPAKGLHNRTFFEYTDNHFRFSERADLADYTFSGPVPPTTLLRNLASSAKGYVLRNHLEYEIAMGGLTANAGIVFTRIDQKLKYENRLQNLNNSGINYMYYKEPQKITTLTPIINLSFKNIISGYISKTQLFGKPASVASLTYTSDARHSSFQGLVLNIKNLLKLDKANRLDMLLDHSRSTVNYGGNYWLPLFNPQMNANSSIFRLNTTFINVLGQNPPVDIRKEELIAVQLNTSFLKGKLSAGLEWNKLQYESIHYEPNYFIVGNIIERNVGFYAGIKLIDQPGRQWMTRLNILLPDIKFKSQNITSFDPQVITYKMRMSVHNQFRFRQFYCQAVGLFGFGRNILRETSTIQKGTRSTELILNYLQLGYDLIKSNKSFLQQASLFVHANRLLADDKTFEYYRENRFAGIGVNLKF